MKELSPQVRDALTAVLPTAVEEVVAAVAAEVPAYRRPLAGAFGADLRRGVVLGLEQFLDAPTAVQRTLRESEREVYAELGRTELREGRPLESLLAAYRVGARTAFRRFAGVAVAAGLPAEDLIRLADALFAHIDQLSAASSAGWASEQRRQAGRLDRQRHDLLDALLSGAADPVTVRTAAAGVGWAVTDVLVVVAVAATADDKGRPGGTPGADAVDTLALRLGDDALVGWRGEHAVALLPAGKDREQRSRRLLDLRAAVSPPTAWPGLPAALRLALLGLRLPPTGAVVHVGDRLADLLLLRDRALLEALVTRRLAPLDRARPASQERLAETLLAWLAHRGARGAVARELRLHPQTVAYRLGLLRELFGADLDDTTARFELEVALRGRMLLRESP